MSAYESAVALIHREAACLDENRWKEWLALYAEPCEYWVPMWRTEDEIVSDPDTGLSHIYYTGKAGLEDRVSRITSRKSPASRPLPRTAHVIGTHLLLEETDAAISVRSAWSCHVVFPRRHDTHAFFGFYRHDLDKTGDGLLIRRKHVTLLNDYIPTMLDVYCV